MNCNASRASISSSANTTRSRRTRRASSYSRCNWDAAHSIQTALTGQTAWDYVNAELKPILGGRSWHAIEKDGTLRVVDPPADLAR